MKNEQATGACLRALRKTVGASLAAVAARGGWASTSGVSTVEASILCDAATVVRYVGALRAFVREAKSALDAFESQGDAGVDRALAAAKRARIARRIARAKIKKTKDAPT